MAFITADQTKVIRTDLKKAFPDFRFSVRTRHHSSVDVAVMSGPINFSFKGEFCNTEDRYKQVNHFYLDRIEDGIEREFLKKVSKIIHKEHWDKSDIQSDYFACAFYVNISVGQWDKPYQLK